MNGIRLEPGTVPRNGLPEQKPYVYKGTGTEMSPAEIVKHLRRQLAEVQYAPVLAMAEAEPVTRADLLLAMSPPCWEDACHDCPGVRCICACHDGRPPLAAAAVPDPAPEPPERCEQCGYLVTSAGHKITCGGTS